MHIILFQDKLINDITKQNLSSNHCIRPNGLSFFSGLRNLHAYPVNKFIIVSKIFIFQIYLPSGTYIQTRLWVNNGVNVIEVDISPSRSDVHQSEGLCSKLGSNKLIKRDGSTASPNEFTLSWR